MALIKTIAELRALIPRVSKLSDAANLPNMDKAAWKYIIPLIGQDLYDDLQTKYDDSTLSANETKLLKLIQLPLAAGAIFDELPYMHTLITDNGIRTPETNQMRAAQKWEYNYLKAGLVATIVEGQEMLLNFLFLNKPDWALWTDSDAYKVYTRYLIRNGLEFDMLYKLKDPMRTFQLLKPIMDDVDEMYLATRLGRSLLAWLKTQSNVIVQENGGEVDILSMLKKSMAHFTVKHACSQQQVLFTDAGFTVPIKDVDIPGAEGVTQANLEAIAQKMEVANREGQNYLTKAVMYIKALAEADPGSIPAGFTAAFEQSPLYVAPGVITEAITNGNERRKGVFRLGS